MKKITALLLCFLLLCMCSVTGFAAEPENGQGSAVISVTVPDCHRVIVTAPQAQVFFEGSPVESFFVDRLSRPRLLIRAESGQVIKTVTVNTVDVTAELFGGYLDLAPVCEDLFIVVTTEAEPAPPEDTFTVSGKVTLNGEPLGWVDLELRSTLKTTMTDKQGSFAFRDVEQGKHSLTALKGGKVIGYLSFELKTDNTADVTLLENGAYVVSFDENSAGVELHLELNEETGTLVPTLASASQTPSAPPSVSPSSPPTGDNSHMALWWTLMILSAVCVAVLVITRRKKDA